jgi:hypothetical protein
MKRTPNLASERGAVLIQTAIAALVLVGFGTFVVDYGVLWVARHQAQNAADAGAMAGALARAYEDFDDPPDPGGVAAQYAQQVSGANLVWGASAPTTAAVPSFDGVCPPDVGAPTRCVRMDVYRNGEQGSTPLQAWFGHAFGITSQGVKATARAQVMIANATNCLRPWAIPDKWLEGGTSGPEFQAYGAGGALLAPGDTYTPPSAIDAGTGFRFPTTNATPEDLGAVIALSSYTGNAADPIFRGVVVPLALPGGYAPSIAACNGQMITVGDQLPISIPDTPTNMNDIRGLIVEDGGAGWSPASNTIDGSCAPVCAPISPRLVAVATFDVDLFQYHLATGDWTACPAARPGCPQCAGGIPCVSVVNIVGLFVRDAIPNAHVTSYPGVVPTGPPLLTVQSSFLKAIALIR